MASAAGKGGHAEQLNQATAIASADNVRSSDVASDQSAEILKMLVNAVLQMDARMKSIEVTLEKILKQTENASDLKKSAGG
jgi:hypothetical protein